MVKVFTNAKMAEMLFQLKPVLAQRNRIGYMAARNYRAISNSLIEYEAFRRELLEKYGEVGGDPDGTGQPCISIKIGSPNFKQFCEELEVYSNMEHDVELMIAKYEDAVGVLSGEEILAIEWMLED